MSEPLSIMNENQRAYMRRWMSAFRKTPEGKATFAWGNIKERCAKPVGKNAAYKGVRVELSRAEFMQWAVPAYRAWMQAHPGEVPSIDRINSSLGYALGNLRILEWGRNAATRRNTPNAWAKAGEAWCSGCRAYYTQAEFHTNSHRANGYSNYCKRCKQSQRLARYASVGT